MLFRYKQFSLFPYEYLFHLRRMVHDEAKDFLVDWRCKFNIVHANYRVFYIQYVKVIFAVKLPLFVCSIQHLFLH